MPLTPHSFLSSSTIRLDQITLSEIRLPLREPFRISSGTVSERRITLLELRDADGAVAWSEGVAPEQPHDRQVAITPARSSNS